MCREGRVIKYKGGNVTVSHIYYNAALHKYTVFRQPLSFFFLMKLGKGGGGRDLLFCSHTFYDK